MNLEEFSNYACVIRCDRCGDENIHFLNLWLIGIAYCKRCKRFQFYRRAGDLLHKHFRDYWWKRIPRAKESLKELEGYGKAFF